MLDEYYIYIMASITGTLYVGSTGNIVSRVYEHRNKLIGGFTRKYGCNRLLYYEIFNTKRESLKREQQIKKFNRTKKEQLINKLNPEWQDLAKDWYIDLNVIQSLIHRKWIPRRASSGL
jgi:putative endonuclease